MAWWFWIILGLAFLVLELLMPGGFFLFFFGAAGLILGVVVLALPNIEAWMQWIAFSVLSVGLLLAFRQRLIQILKSSKREEVDSLVNQEGEVSEVIQPGSKGTVHLRGSPWQALNVGAIALTVGGRCRVVGVDGLTLKVEAKS